MVRDLPRLRSGAPPYTTQAPCIPPVPQTSQAMVAATVAAPPAQPARGEGDFIVMDCVYRSCLVIIGGFETRVDLLLLNMVEFDVILDMDWLLPYQLILDCHTKNVTLALPGLSRLEWRGTFDHIPSRVVSFLRAQRMVEKGCEAYLAFVRDVSVDTPTIKSVMIVRHLLDMFPVYLPSMPPDRDINFGIDLLPGTQPHFYSTILYGASGVEGVKETTARAA
ncbi:uncharacterized protein [Nicotiana tomentosiformis]|uniref:uncharacterized protein n=1 Tax=Nicotiana tomentosiformis TaxID=4098 RepID=UPI00388C8A0F